jgi:hypothetical protein
VPNLDIDYTPTVLQNRGVPIALNIFNDDGSQAFEADGTPKREIFYVRMTAGTMMALETEFNGYTIKTNEPEIRGKNVLETDPETGETNLVTKQVSTGGIISVEQTFYGAEALEEAGKREPFGTVVKTVSICLGLPREEVANRLITDQMQMYFVAITGAIQIAQGSDPFQIQRLLESSAAAVDAGKRATDAGLEIITRQSLEMVEEVGKTLDQASGLLGSNGSDTGQEDSEETTKPSSS